MSRNNRLVDTPHPRVDKSLEVHRAVLDPNQVIKIRSDAEKMVQEIASDSRVPARSILRWVSTWNYSQPFVRETVDAIASDIKVALKQRGGKFASGVGHAVDASLFVLSGSHQQRTHAHQDISYKWNREPAARYAWTTWIALDCCDGDTGALRFSDGFPTRPVAPREDFLRPDFEDRAHTEQWLDSETIASVNVGDIVVFDALTWHASAAKKEAGVRMALAIRWRSSIGWEDDIDLSAPDQNTAQFGMDTSGQVLCEAILDACGAGTAFPVAEGRTQQVLELLLSQCSSVVEQLTPDSREALTDLATALTLAERYQARPAVGVWRRVCDKALPELRRLATGRGL